MSSMVHSITQVLIWLVFIFPNNLLADSQTQIEFFHYLILNLAAKLNDESIPTPKMFSFIHFIYPSSLKSEKTI